VPVTVPLDHSQDGRVYGYPVTGTLPTQTTRQTLALAVPFITQFYNGGITNTPVEQPIGTILSEPHHGLVVPPPFIVANYTPGWARLVTEPLGTITATDHHSLVVPFLASYYNGRDAVHPVTEAMGTVSTVDRHALVVPEASDEPRVEDCGFRMLVPHEIKAAMAFPSDYILLGNQRQQVRLLGNAVTPPVMSMLFQRCVETLQ